MPAGAFTGQGSVIERADLDTPTEFTKIAQVKTIGGPNSTSNMLDTTTLDSEAMEFVPGLKDNGEASLGLNFVPGDPGQQQMLEDQDTQAMAIYRITFADKKPTGGTTATFQGYVTSFGPSIGVNALSTADATIKISGRVDWVYATFP